MATLETRGNSVRVNWRLGGSRTGARQSCTFSGDTPRAAKKLAEAAKKLVESRDHALTRAEVYDLVLGPADDVDAGILTFKEWVDTWIADRARMRDVQPDVITSYRRILTSRAVPYLGHLRLNAITDDKLRDWIAWMSGSYITIGSKNRRTGDRLLSSTTIRRTHAILHACLGAAVAKKLILANPAARPAGAAKHTTGLPRKESYDAAFLTVDELHLLLDHCDPQIRDLVEVAAHSGLRLGELIALQVRDVVFDREGDATIMVRRSRKNDGSIGAPKSEKSRRDVPLAPPQSAVLRARVTGRKPGALVFPSPLGGMWDENNLRGRYWYPSVAAAMRCPEHPPPAPPKPARGPTRALRVDEVSTCSCRTRLHRRPRLHDLRHSHASYCIGDGMHAKKIQARLGHATYQITMDVYGHLMDRGSKEELARISDRLTRRPVAATPANLPRRNRSAVRRARAVPVQRAVVRRSTTR